MENKGVFIRRQTMRLVGVLSIFCCLVCCCPLNIFAQGVFSKLDIEARGSLDFYSQYLWRGFALDTDPVIQPGISLSTKGFTFSFWSSWDADNNDALNSDEIDYCIDYTKEFDALSVSLGHTYYDFPGSHGYSKEFYVGVGAPSILLSPTLTYYHDYGDEENGGGDGDYVALAVSKSFDIFEDSKITFDLNAAVGYNNELFINGNGGDFLVGAGFTVPLTDKLTFSPTVNYSVPFSDLKDSDDGDQKNRFYSGAGFAYSF